MKNCTVHPQDAGFCQHLQAGRMKGKGMILKRGTLSERIISATSHAISSGALLSIPTDYTFIEDDGIRFFVRVLASLSLKDEARKEQEQQAEAGKSVNPFLPPEKDLTVADISETHLAILNKFNVMEHHLLIITRHFENQNMLLTLSDFEALWACMAEYDALGFYNGGREAGASQQHKHLQLVPLPLAPEGPVVPIAPLLAQVSGEVMGTVRGFPFLHVFVRLDRSLAESPVDAARTTYHLYGEMLRNTGLASPQGTSLTLQSAPYCFLLTREWMLLVPRSKEFFDGISFNSLAFAGSLFVRDDQQLDRLKNFGPMNALKSVSLKSKPDRF
jgi:sulfate adenylyltransferase (ADP) / ATP adenylyltransferase